MTTMLKAPLTSSRARLSYRLTAIPAIALVASFSVTATAQASTSLRAAGKTVTLIAENAESGDTGLVSIFSQAATAFNKLHPGVHVVMRSETFDSMQSTAVLDLSGSNPPSVYQVNQGWISIARLAQDKLLLPLTSYAKQYNWDSRQSKNLLAYDGEVAPGRLGQGTLYGIAVDADVVGLWYNKTLLAKIHQPVPTTFTQFTNDLALAKKMGVTPLTLGVGSGGDSDFHVLMDILYSTTPEQDIPYIRNLIDGNPPSTWTTPIMVKALTTLQQWANDGYFTPGYTGLTLSAAISQFTSGHALFFVGGNYYSGQIIPPMGNNVGFALPPSGTPTHGPIAEASGGLAWAIPTHSPHHDLAAEFINFLTGPTVARMFLKTQQFPILAVPGESALLSGPLAQVAKVTTYLLAGNRAMPWLSINTPDSFDKLVAYLPELMANKTTALNVAKGLEQDELQFRATLKS